MAITISNIVSGVTSVKYVIDPSYGSSENWATAPDTAFAAEGTPTDLGGLDGPVTLEYNGEFVDIDVEQDTFIVSKLLKMEKCKVKFVMAEAALTNLRLAMAGVGAPSGNVIQIGPAAGSTLHFVALQILGAGPGALPYRRVTIPKCFAVGTVGVPFTKGGIQKVPVEFDVIRAQDTAAANIPCVWIKDAAS